MTHPRPARNAYLFFSFVSIQWLTNKSEWLNGETTIYELLNCRTIEHSVDCIPFIYLSQPYLYWRKFQAKCTFVQSVCCTHPPLKTFIMVSASIDMVFQKPFKTKRNQLTEIDYFVNVSPITCSIQHPSNGAHQRVHCLYQSKAQSISSNNKFNKNEPHGNETNARQQMNVIKEKTGHRRQHTKTIFNTHILTIRWWHSFDH